MGYEVITSCLAGNTAALLEDGATFYCVFNTKVQTAIGMAEEVKMHFN